MEVVITLPRCQGMSLLSIVASSDQEVFIDLLVCHDIKCNRLWHLDKDLCTGIKGCVRHIWSNEFQHNLCILCPCDHAS